MKQALDKLIKNPFWIFLTAIIPLKDLFKNFFLIVVQHNKMTISEAASHTDWGSFLVQLILVTIVYLLLKRVGTLQDKIVIVETTTTDSKEIGIDMNIRFIQLKFRIECFMKHNGEEWHPKREKELVEQYLRTAQEGLSVADLNRIMKKHFLELPNVI